MNLGKFNNTTTNKDIILEIQPNGCIKCLSHCCDSDGYVRIRYKGKHDRLFRVLYQQKYGEIPKGLVLRHLCNNSWCCNVEHLKPGTSKENFEDCVKCGRAKIGIKGKKIMTSKSKTSKLTEEEVKDIYKSDDAVRILVSKYNVSKTTILNIKNKVYWSWLTDTLD